MLRANKMIANDGPLSHSVTLACIFGYRKKAIQL